MQNKTEKTPSFFLKGKKNRKHTFCIEKEKKRSHHYYSSICVFFDLLCIPFNGKKKKD